MKIYAYHHVQNNLNNNLLYLFYITFTIANNKSEWCCKILHEIRMTSGTD